MHNEPHGLCKSLLHKSITAAARGSRQGRRASLEPSLGAPTFTGTDRLKLLTCLGAGGMGVVYEAMDEERGTRVALKLLPHLDADSLARFKNEFRAVQGIYHPNLVRLSDLQSMGDHWFFTMELVDGTNFLSWVRPRSVVPSAEPAAPGSDDATQRRPPPGAADETLRVSDPAAAAAARPDLGPLDLERLRAALVQLGAALRALHEAGKIHRDLKPSNVLVTARGRVVLLDFGLVSEAFDLDHAMVGTLPYMSPEQIEGGRFGPEVDWYALGVVIYEALTGRLPFDGASADIVSAKLEKSPVAPRLLAPDLPGDLCELCTSLLERDPTRRPDGAAVMRILRGERASAAPAAAVSSSPGLFVGRLRELDRLTAAFDDVCAGRGRALTIRGESGIGKTSLVRELLRTLGRRRRDVLFLHGRCYEREAVPYKAIDGVVDAVAQALRREHGRDAADVPPEAGFVAQAFPVLRACPALAQAMESVPRVSSALELRRRVFQGLRALFAWLARRQPVVVVIDDLQWADADSIAALADVLRGEAPPLLFLATARPIGGGGGTGPRSDLALSELGEAVPALETLELGPLTQDESVRLAEAAAAPGASPGRAPQRLAEEAAGHPLFLLELARHGGAMERDRLRLEDILRARVAELEPAARELLELLALASAPIAHPVVAHAAGLGPLELDRHSAHLRAEHLLRSSRSRDAEALEPYHDRVRVAMLASIDDERRRAHHERLALALERGAPAEAEALAVHWRGAGHAARAFGHAVRAAEHAAEALAFELAARLFTMAIELAPAGASQLPSLRRGRAEALADAGRGAEAARAYLEAAEVASAGEILDLRRRAAEQFLRAGHIDEGLGVLEGVLRAVGERLPATPRRAFAALAVGRARIALRGLRYVERPLPEVPPGSVMRVDAFFTAAACLGYVDTIRGADFQARHFLAALDAGEPHRVAQALMLEVSFAGAAGGPEGPRARALIAMLQELAARLGAPHVSALAECAPAIVASLGGRWQLALARWQRAEGLLRSGCRGVSWELTTAHNSILWALYHLGRLRELAELVPNLAREAAERGDRFLAVSVQSGISNAAWLVMDDVPRARAESAAATAHWSRAGFHLQHFWRLLAEGQIDLYEGRGGVSLARIDEEWPALRRSLLLKAQVVRIFMHDLRARSALSLYKAEGATRARCLDEAEADARQLLREKMPWATPLGELILAQVASLRGRRTDARRRLSQAVSGFDEADMALHAAVARHYLGSPDAESWLAEAGARSPSRLRRMLAPGFLE